MQIYLLTVITNILAGAVLSRHFLSEKMEGYKPFADLLDHKLFQLILGIITVLTGVFALFYKVPGDSVVILGNLLPALTALVAGVLILSEYFAKPDDTEGGLLAQLAQFNRSQGGLVGLSAMAVGLLHAIIPTALFL